MCPQVSTGNKYTMDSPRNKKIFEPKLRMCVFANYLLQNAVGSAKFGENCDYNTDCLEGMWCSGGSCQCLSNYIDVGGTYCYAKINPTQSDARSKSNAVPSGPRPPAP